MNQLEFCENMFVSIMCLYVLSSVLWCTLSLYTQLFVWWLMSYLCLLAYSVVFLLRFSSSCVPYVASFSGLSIVWLPLPCL